MNIHDDFEEFLRLLAGQQIEFVIVGGYAVAFHGYVRATQDIDIFFAVPMTIPERCFTSSRTLDSR